MREFRGMCIEYAHNQWLQLEWLSTLEFITKGTNHVQTNSLSPPLHFISPSFSTA